MRSTLRSLFAVVVLWAGASCGDSTGPGNVSGSYALQTIDGLDLPRALPVTTACGVFLSQAVCAETLRLEVRDGSVRFDADSTYRIQTLFRRTQPSGSNTDVTSTLRGQWSLVGGQLSLVDTLGTQRSGTLVGGTVTIDVVENMDWMYSK